MPYKTTTPIVFKKQRYETGSIVEMPQSVAARSLKRGDIVEVKKGEPEPIVPVAPPAQKLDLRNPNADTIQADLGNIPNIGKALAERIVEVLPIEHWEELPKLTKAQLASLKQHATIG
jgi:hypothetical protein